MGDLRSLRLLAALVLLVPAACRTDDERPRVEQRVDDPSATVPSTPGPAFERYVLWAPAGLPARSERILDDEPGVRRVTTVVAGLHWADRFEAGGESTGPGDGGAVPVEVAYVDPLELRHFVDPNNTTDYVHRRPAGPLGVPARTFARMHGAGDDYMKMQLTDITRTFNLSRAVPDAVTLGFEVLLEAPAPRGWGQRFVLVESRDRRALRRAATRLMEGEPLRIKSSQETPFLRYADAVTPQMYFKEHFGEFSARPQPNGSLIIDPEWVRQNIVTASVPLLGEVTCHRRFITRLRNTLGRVKEQGLAQTVDPGDFGGCYSPRFIGRDPEGRLSSHAWGAAIDINAAANPFGSRPTMSLKLVEVMTDHGLNWGGDWLNPDGMHFEWRRD
ncbi:MAG: M15 family metallopeptidase [Actinomycetota bacterium]